MRTKVERVKTIPKKLVRQGVPDPCLVKKRENVGTKKNRWLKKKKVTWERKIWKTTRVPLRGKGEVKPKGVHLIANIQRRKKIFTIRAIFSKYIRTGHKEREWGLGSVLGTRSKGKKGERVGRSTKK